ncbi:MAG TPA: BatA domain-containing protein [Candidatus Limnocylindrales bacterium]|nr:BatA domain-containing protein [Candidatus Limnocylindrales bacterium]
MSFLAPLFLLGAAAVGLPIVFHLIRRTTRQRIPFSSLMFLFPTPPRLTQRSRLEDILLLVLRCSIIGLLAVGFSRPFIRKPVNPAPSSDAKRILLLLDTSASMRRANLWSDAREKVQSVLRQTSPADQVGLFTFDRELKPLVTFEQWNAIPLAERVPRALRLVAVTTPGWAATRLDSALLRAAEILADSSNKQALAPGEIILISDLQEGSHLDLLQGFEWPRNVAVEIEPLKPRHTDNASLQLVGEEDGDPKSTTQVRVRVTNSNESRRDQFKVGWTGADGRSFAGAPTELYVPPGQSRILSLAPPLPGVNSTCVLLQGDAEDFDNVAFALPADIAQLKVLYFGGESESDPKQSLYFLKRAFQETRRQTVQVQSNSGMGKVADDQVQAAQLVIVQDSLRPELVNTLRDALAAGKTMLFALKTEGMGETLAALLGLNQLNVTEVRPATYAMLAEIDFRDPLFVAFADPRFSDFTRIHFWKYRRLDAAAIPQARVLAKFDTGDPALLEVPAGKGRVLILASSWQPEDSQLALSTKFVPLLYSMLETTGAARGFPVHHLVGDIVPLNSIAEHGTSSLTITTPNKTVITIPSGETNFSETLVPGIYTVASDHPLKTFAVNLDPAEGRTAPLAADELERLGVPLKHPNPPASFAAERKSRLDNAELENRQKLWRWLIIAALLTLLLETWLAGRAQRRKLAALDSLPMGDSAPKARNAETTSSVF